MNAFNFIGVKTKIESEAKIMPKLDRAKENDEESPQTNIITKH